MMWPQMGSEIKALTHSSERSTMRDHPHIRELRVLGRGSAGNDCPGFGRPPDDLIT